MKRYLVGFGVALALFAAVPAQAGGVAPAVTPEVIVEDTGSSASHDFLVPLMLLIFVAAAAQGS